MPKNTMLNQPLTSSSINKVKNTGDSTAGLKLSRRAALAAGLTAAGAAVMTGFTPADLDNALAAVGEGKVFDPALLLDIARQMAQRPYVASSSSVPEDLDSLSYDQYVNIRAKENAHLWHGDERGFTVEPLHRGFVFTKPVKIYAVNDGIVNQVRYSRDMFNFGSLPLNLGSKSSKFFNQNSTREDGNEQTEQSATSNTNHSMQDEAQFGFSGFRIYSDAPGEPAQELAIFQGATFFRSKARGQNYGVHAHTLMLRPTEAKGEELPQFRAFWIERPQIGTGALVIHALLDSQSVTGVVRYTLRPGDIAITDVELTLIPRTQLDHIGIGGATANFLFGPVRPKNTPDTRIAVQDVGGLQIHNGQSEWLWRTLDNPRTLQISAFLDKNPKGFGLLQRVREFSAYEDDIQHFELRPSLWVEPLEEWGDGSVQLLEVPTSTESTPNIISYWRPATPLLAGVETRYAMRLHWCWSVPGRPAIALVRGARIGALPNSRIRRFAITFTGDTLGRDDIAAHIKVGLTASHGTIQNARLWPYPDRKMVRVLFDFDPGNDTSSELRLALIEAGQPISENWLFRWTP